MHARMFIKNQTNITLHFLEKFQLSRFNSIFQIVVVIIKVLIICQGMSLSGFAIEQTYKCFIINNIVIDLWQ